MPKQRWLPPCGQESLEALWERLPAACRRDVILQYARLIEHAVRPSRSPEEKEEHHDSPRR